MFSSLDEIKAYQKTWALAHGLHVDDKGYVDHLADNLFLKGMTESFKKAFEAGQGSELSSEGRKPKLLALHSSAALVVNVFDYWERGGAYPLATALECQDISSIVPEKIYRTGLRGTAPQLDIDIRLSDNTVLVIESKFTEWLTPKVARDEQFRASYFPQDGNLWQKRELHGSAALAQDIQSRHIHFEYLDAQQLLSHALGLATQLEQSYTLVYLYYDVAAEERVRHQAELQAFQDRVAGDFAFRTMTYQSLFTQMKLAARAEDAAYMNYLENRYFPEAVI